VTNKSMVTVYGAISPGTSPAIYAAVAYLANRGECRVTVKLPYGVRPFPRVPITVYVDTDSAFVEFPKDKAPELTVMYWEPVPFERG